MARAFPVPAGRRRCSPVERGPPSLQERYGASAPRQSPFLVRDRSPCGGMRLANTPPVSPMVRIPDAPAQCRTASAVARMTAKWKPAASQQADSAPARRPSTIRRSPGRIRTPSATSEPGPAAPAGGGSGNRGIEPAAAGGVPSSRPPALIADLLAYPEQGWRRRRTAGPCWKWSERSRRRQNLLEPARAGRSSRLRRRGQVVGPSMPPGQRVQKRCGRLAHRAIAPRQRERSQVPHPAELGRVCQGNSSPPQMVPSVP